MTLLEARDVSAYYGQFQALKGISLHVEAGETVAIIGANGAGKSTFLKVLAGVLRTGREAVRWEGQAIGELPAPEVLRRGIALVPEGRRLFPSLTVEENLLIGCDFLAGDKRAKLSEIYALFPSLAERRRVLSHKLSGGEQQMAAIGRALISAPRLLLCDEVSLGLAPKVVNGIYAIFPQFKARGMALVIVEQDVSRALAVADRFYCLQDGRISLHGRPGDFGHEAIQVAYFGLEGTC